MAGYSFLTWIAPNKTFLLLSGCFFVFFFKVGKMPANMNISHASGIYW